MSLILDTYVKYAFLLIRSLDILLVICYNACVRSNKEKILRHIKEGEQYKHSPATSMRATSGERVTNIKSGESKSLPD